ncbi:YqaJ viral recombinase family protein [Microbulbifer sp. 2201CG32-9]|uniref:YqaJ viral recombinase family protein n=1 Tax=Microbulbifer sp. 2201CG32-9 TaxID=3232309 RepID=UPI00345B6F08
MQILNLTQGSVEWHAARVNYFTASEAPAMMGESKYKTRSQFIKEKATGLSEGITDAQYRLFQKGHEAEASIRSHIEHELGDELFPATGVSDCGTYLASFDGITMDESLIWEHKLYSVGLADSVRAGTLEPHYYWQLEHQLLVSGAEKAVFTTSDGSPDACYSMEYVSVPERRAALIAGWQQFAEDLSNYKPETEQVEVTGHAPETLPALRIEVTGMVTASNLQQFQDRTLTVFQGINTELKTDQHFADAEQTVKWCKEVEQRLSAAKDHALSQTQSIDELFRAIDDISAQARSKRLELEKLVKARKKEIREEIAMSACEDLMGHIGEINKTLDNGVRMPPIITYFDGVMKGKRTLASLRDAVSTELARAKIEANQIADKIRLNLKTLRGDTAGYETLFADVQQLVLKDNDDLRATITARIAEHKAADQERQQAEQVQQKIEPQSAEISASRELGSIRQTTAENSRPSDQQIIGVLARHYRVHESKVHEWLLDMDLQGAGDALASNF